MKLLFASLFSLFILLSINNNTETVNGVVIDENGMPLIGATIMEKKSKNHTTSDIKGEFKLTVSKLPTVLKVSYVGYETKTIKCTPSKKKYTIKLIPGPSLNEVKVAKKVKDYAVAGITESAPMTTNIMNYDLELPESEEAENYSDINENQFKNPTKNPLSTLSIDVDRASYANVRRFLNNGQMPPANAVRIEEMINYFDYKYEFQKQKNNRPFNTFIELADCNWNSQHKLLKVGLKAQNMERIDKKANNLVFLIDVSGSMNSANKLPLLKSAFKLLVDQMQEEDKISIVVYAGAAGVVLEPTSGKEKEKIMDALNKLNAGGSTAGGAGINLAYKLAKEHFIKDGNNRVILATDGDFNVGTSDDDSLVKLIEKKRESNIFLSILAFGTGNYMDGKMQKIANAGNGNHNYIDNMREAKKVLMDEFSGTLYTIAKDVKIQIEFNPAAIEGYRMIGYENRVLAAEDFNNDKKDAGEMGADHTVTVLYEIIPKGAKSDYNVSIDPLKYSDNKLAENIKWAKELATIKYRYKNPDAKNSIKSEEIIYNKKEKDFEESSSTEWASYVAEFGLLLRDSAFKSNANYDRLITDIKRHVKDNPDSYKQEMLDLVVLAKSMDSAE